MVTLKTYKSKRLIPQNTFEVCLADNIKLKEITKLYTRYDIKEGKKSCYVLEKFIFHLKQKHDLDIISYCETYLGFEWPLCPIKNTKVGYKILGRGILLSDYAQGAIDTNNEKMKRHYEKMSKERVGPGNPMFNKDPWNLGKTKETNSILKSISEKAIGTKMSESSKEKMRKRRMESPIKKRHTTPHSKETIEKLRENTARLWAEGVFNRTTSIHLKMREFLESLQLLQEFKEEHQIKYFSLDFAFPYAKIGIECQGTYFHIDPRVYPNGPINKMQKRNYGRDKAKRAFCKKIGWEIIEVWETEINDGTFKEELICKLKKLKLLKS